MTNAGELCLGLLNTIDQLCTLCSVYARVYDGWSGGKLTMIVCRVR